MNTRKRKFASNAVAAGVVDTALHKGNLEARLANGTFTEPKDIADAVVYLTEAGHVTGEVLHVDDGGACGQVVSVQGSQASSAERRLQDAGHRASCGADAVRQLRGDGADGPSAASSAGCFRWSITSRKYVGRLGKELDAEAGRDAVRTAALSVLAAARKHLGSLDRVTRVVRLGCSWRRRGIFSISPRVADGASDLFRDVFGAGKMAVAVGDWRGQPAAGDAGGGLRLFSRSRSKASTLRWPSTFTNNAGGVMATLAIATATMKSRQISKPGAGFDGGGAQRSHAGAGQVRD